MTAFLWTLPMEKDWKKKEFNPFLHRLQLAGENPEAAIEDSNELKITHEIIANHLGSHREVITRMLRYFQSEGIVKLSRGKITLLNPERLEALASS